MEINKERILYEDNATVAVLVEKPSAMGHVRVFPKKTVQSLDELDDDTVVQLFYVASYAATAVFEGLKAQATNIIVKSGTCDDNPKGQLVMHVFPRSESDSLKQVNWEPKQPSYALDSIVSKIKDKTWVVKYEGKSEEKKVTKNQLDQMPKVIKIGNSKKNTTTTSTSSKDEIKNAIEKMHKL